MLDNKQINRNLQSVFQLGEGQFIEFKETVDKNLQKEIVAFANASGGTIYIGVTDSGVIKGTTITNRMKSQLQDLAYNCDPSIVVFLIEMDKVLAVEVKEGVNKPYSCASGFYMRMGANSQKMRRDEILALAVKSGKVRFDEQVCPDFDWKDFDNEKFEHFLKLAGISSNLSKEEMLMNLRVLTKEGLTNAGVLYFAKEPYKYIISSRIRCVHFNDDERIEILDKKVIDRGIIGNIEYAVGYLQELVPVRYEIKELERDEYPEYPIEAYREAIVNAIIHFDYFLGDTIAIEKLKSSIVVNNKGELLFPESDFGKRSEARNRLLADLLTRTKYMEKAGTGIKRVKDACAENGNECIFDFNDAFWVTIHSNIDDTDNDTDNDTDRKNIILSIIQKNSKITINEIAKKLGISKSTILRDIKKLKTNNKLRRIGSEKKGYWEIIEK